MAFQELRLNISEFRLDLHGTGVKEARRVVEKRVAECHLYGINVLKVVYGTPDDFDRSVAKAIHQLVRYNELVASEMLTDYVLSDAKPDRLGPELRIHLRPNPEPQPITEDTQFAPFEAKYETDVAKRLRCGKPYFPLRAPRPARRVSAKPEAVQLRQEPPPADIETPPSDPTDTLLRTLTEAKQLALDSKYEDAEQRLLEIVTSPNTPTKIADDSRLELARVHAALRKPEAEGELLSCITSLTSRLGRGPHLLPALHALGSFYAVVGDHDALLKLARDSADLEKCGGGVQLLNGILKHALLEFSAGKYTDSLHTLQFFSHARDDAEISASLDAQRYRLLGMNYAALFDLFLADLAFKCSLQCCRSNQLECQDIELDILMRQGIIFRKKERYAEAVSIYKDVRRILRSQGRQDSILFGDVMSSMGVACKNLGELENAEKCFAEASTAYKKEGRNETPEYAKVLSNWGNLRIVQKRYDEAEAFLNQAHELLALKTAAAFDSLVIVQTALGGLYGLRGEAERGQVALEQTVEMAESNLGKKSIRTAMAKEALADLLLHRGQSVRSAELYTEAFDVAREMDSNSSYANQLRSKLEKIAADLGRTS